MTPILPLKTPSTHAAAMKAFAANLRVLVGDAKGLRPLLCEGDPLTCTVALVGANPGTTTPFWTFWSDESGMNRRSWIETYKADHDGRVRRSRAAIERFVPLVSARVVELNAHVAHSKRIAALPIRLRTTDVLDFVLSVIKPKVIVCAGANASRAVEGIDLPWRPAVLKTKHFIYWGKASEWQLAADVNRLL